ncbi:AAA family ATPase [Ruminococcaceae bacterium OttesenSCG-928-I18]|nr:AAA family ATPase [Ruminococcaceae bacterium OttesenSCG-928-I18]
MREYVRPKLKPKPVTSVAEQYISLRKISKETAAAYHIGTDAEGNIMFPYFDENGEHVFNKFRFPRKLAPGERKAWRETDTKPVLFGMDKCDTSFPLTICEGEFDAMSLHEAGIPNAVSVPSGAEDYTWLDTCWDFLQTFDKIYLFGDNDEAGRKMLRTLTVKLSDKGVYVVEHLCKDANALLYKHGPQAVKDAWEAAKPVPIAGLLNLAEITPLDMKNAEKVSTSISELNRVFGGFLMGDVTVWTGKRGEGKSTVLSQILLDAIEDGKRVCAYSGELRADRFQYWVDLQAAGPEHVKCYDDEKSGRTVYFVEKENRKMIHNWYDGYFWLYDNAITLTDEESTVLKVFERAAKRHDCKVFLIDNLMTVDFGKMNEKDYLLRQTQFINQVAAFANLYNVHVHLVAHPRKTEKITDADDVSGSGNVTNRVSNVISVKRANDNVGFGVALEVMKNRWEGEYGTIGLNYDGKCRRVYQPTDGNNLMYGWEKNNFIPVEETEDLPW